ncbi:Mesaconyl-CoA hydratase [invertebrate metagenome]|uniref:Mesaconyl-CoA hydratase n=1 Tax=invertebrate metagenome TaxID=1711999 RepID=A0A484H5T7_9ZZZZ
MINAKTNPGNFFEHFKFDQEMIHPTPRTITAGDVAIYQALFGSRFAVSSDREFARAIGLPNAPIDDLLAFHIVFGKTVPEISLNAVANLGYADGHFGAPVYIGDTITAVSRVIGLKENSDRKSGVVYIRSTGLNQHDEMVVDYVRWVMVRKQHESAPSTNPIIPNLPQAVPASALVFSYQLRMSGYDLSLSGSAYLWDDYEVGEKIDHVDGMTIEEAEHQMATRLYQNTAKVHFNLHEQAQGRFKRRLIYGGHIISLVRALSFNGLGNAFQMVAINAGTHANPTFAGDTIYCWSEVLDKLSLPRREDIGALRLRTVAVKDRPCGDFPYKGEDGRYTSQVVLDFDYTVLVPRKAKQS